MKNLALVFVLLIFGVSLYGKTNQTQPNGKVFMIHKSKRVFIDKKERAYLKNKGNEQPKQNQSGSKKNN